MAGQVICLCEQMPKLQELHACENGITTIRYTHACPLSISAAPVLLRWSTHPTLPALSERPRNESVSDRAVKALASLSVLNLYGNAISSWPLVCVHEAASLRLCASVCLCLCVSVCVCVSVVRVSVSVSLCVLPLAPHRAQMNRCVQVLELGALPSLVDLKLNCNRLGDCSDFSRLSNITSLSIAYVCICSDRSRAPAHVQT